VFNPKVDSPLSVIVEAHQGDPGYLEKRAIEMIGESNLALGVGPLISDLQYEQYHDKMIKAISLLALARCARKKLQAAAKEPRQE
jgi:siroheme synthase